MDFAVVIIALEEPMFVDLRVPIGEPNQSIAHKSMPSRRQRWVPVL
jgi:hypothetical protein